MEGGEERKASVIWIQGNCILREAEEPGHFKPDSKHRLLPRPWDNVAGAPVKAFIVLPLDKIEGGKGDSKGVEGRGESISAIYVRVFIPAIRLSAVSILRLAISGIRTPATESISADFMRRFDGDVSRSVIIGTSQREGI